MKKKFAAFVLCLICLLSAVGCGQAKPDTQTPPTADQSAIADDYLTTISGTYVELFPELSKPEYRTIWIDATTITLSNRMFQEIYRLPYRLIPLAE